MPTGRQAAIGLGLLTLINLLNYLDRYVVAGILPAVREALSLTARDAGFLQSAFLITYIAASPIAGYFGDRIPRKYLIASGVIIWSIATVASGLVQTYPHLLIARAFIGVGEAGYATVAPALISDLFTRERRGKMLAVFYAAIPIGSALGFVVGGWMSAHYGWRSAFYVAGAPGFLLALISLGLKEPERGIQEDEEGEAAPPFWASVKLLATNRIYLINNAGYTLMTFALGGMAVWMPTFFVQVFHVPLDHADTVFGGITVVAGFLGTAAGGWAGDVALKRHPGGYLWVSGLGLLLGAPLVALSALSPTVAMSYGAAAVGMFFLFSNTGPINASLVNSVPAHLRAAAVALNILCIHLLGDALSPPLLGWLADLRGMRFAVAANFVPLLIGGAILILGARKVGGATDRAQGTAL